MAKKKEKKAGKRMKKSEMSERLISLFHTKPNETFIILLPIHLISDCLIIVSD